MFFFLKKMNLLINLTKYASIFIKLQYLGIKSIRDIATNLVAYNPRGLDEGSVNECVYL